MRSEEPVLAAEFQSDWEAQMAHALMKSVGIPSVLRSTTPSIQHPNWADVDNVGKLLMVPPSFLAQAQELLASSVSEEDLIREAESVEQSESTKNADSTDTGDETGGIRRN